MNVIPTRLVWEVVCDGAGQWDTRAIDLELGRRGAQIESGILVDLRKVADRDLIEEDNASPQGTGPRWRLTDRGAAWLDSSREHWD